MKFRDLMIQRAQLDQKTVDLGPEDPTFTELLNTLHAIHKGKGYLYGNYIEQMDMANPRLALIKHYCDMERKTTRLKNFITKIADGERPELTEHLDSLSDTAVYAIMGLQLIYAICREEGHYNVDGIT